MKGGFLAYGVIAVLLISNIERAAAQLPKTFSQDPSVFLTEVSRFVVDADKDEGKKVADGFESVWHEGRFSETQQATVIRTCNAMLKKRLKAFPDFKNYLSALTVFAGAQRQGLVFDEWHATIDKVMGLSARHFSTFINTSALLFRDNTLYESVSARWYSTAAEYHFEFDSLPKIVFPVADLVCTAKNDSSLITAVKGNFYPNRKLFVGDGGKVNWRRAGLDESYAVAELNHFLIDVSGTDFFADSVVFRCASYFREPLIGRYSDKILANVTEENASYPRFQSYVTDIEIRDILPGIDFSGGFGLFGSRITGFGDRESSAFITIGRNGKLFFRASSKSFAIRKDRITSDNAAVTFYMENDSVFHPGVTLKYMQDDKELTLIRAEEGKSQAPYMDSYHQIDMYFDALYWKVNEPLIDMRMISAAEESKALFESANYFRKNRFQQMQGIEEVHPLYRVKKYCENHGTRDVYTEDLAKEMRLPVTEVRNMLIRFSNSGFVAYDSREDMATVKDRLYYYLQADVGKVDYDVIQFESVIKALPNASINLLNNEMTLRGVAPVVLSDSQNVVIYPKEQEIKLKKNRDFSFAGRVKAGRFEFHGKDFGFEYQTFKINLNNVDSLRLKVESDDPKEVDFYGNRKLVFVKSVLENINGDLLIDNMINKSGLKEYPEYPVFNSRKDSYVFYDRPSIQQGVYDRDRFYFHLDPFTIDSLDNFSREGLTFGGEFVSAGIFPDFRDSLKLQPDLSLGLVRETGPSGWPAYSGKGTFTNTVSLSNEGLYGDGTLDYLTSHSVSNTFLFLPDSMNTLAERFSNRKATLAGVEFPSVLADTVRLHWEPQKDFMDIYRVRKDLSMYDDQVKMTGNLTLAPAGMTGNGVMQFVTSELESGHFKYKMDVFDADTSNFRLNSDETSTLAFSTNYVQSHIDFTKRFGEFKSIAGGSIVNFPLNQYISFIDRFKWLMDEKELELSASDELATKEVSDTVVTNITLSGSEFVSLDPRQDSLRFKAPFAKYSLKDYLIKAEKVALVQTADAYVIPDSGKVVVERYAKMRTLENARILANTTTKYHTVYNARVDIQGRKRYQASGDYDYIDENKVKHHFHFDDIGVDTAYQTIASGELKDEQGFPLSSNFLFKGGVQLMASHQFLTFSGYAKPNIRCEKITQNWIKFKGDINPENVSIPVNAPVTDGGQKLAAAVAQASDSTGIYAAFLMPKQKASDLEIISASGVLYFDKADKRFKITTEDRLLRPADPGNFLSLDDARCLVYGEGKLDFGSQLGQVEVKTVGNVTTNLNNDSTSVNVLMAVDFPFEEDALKVMWDELSNNALLEPTSDIGRPTYERGITELAGKEKAEKILSELTLYGTFKKMPEELRHTLFLSDLNMTWDDMTRSYRSVGKIGVGSIDKVSVNRKLSGFVEVVHKRSGDALYVYLEPENGVWYYFGYARGLMQTLSSNSSFNDVINKMKPEKRVRKEKDKPDYEFMLTTDRAVRNFLKKMQPQPPAPSDGQ
jgi:hypothetical protein